ncbi:hypothetical protein BJ508DRAFT_164535 [Ascobolus immersus RN42]|uniref:Uncharacterized protein n=1 Tax=Ascobolus immersus RN42 TaxID=1160509 RepID=A0A3N4HX45_ASCIM|nr:hypothetical protein BJ508DRAFT_164535 [Ascobolus immersus RN42]
MEERSDGAEVVLTQKMADMIWKTSVGWSPRRTPISEKSKTASDETDGGKGQLSISNFLRKESTDTSHLSAAEKTTIQDMTITEEPPSVPPTIAPAKTANPAQRQMDSPEDISRSTEKRAGNARKATAPKTAVKKAAPANKVKSFEEDCSHDGGKSARHRQLPQKDHPGCLASTGALSLGEWFPGRSRSSPPDPWFEAKACRTG